MRLPYIPIKSLQGNTPRKNARDTVTVQNIVLVKVIIDRNLLLVMELFLKEKDLRLWGAVKRTE